MSVTTISIASAITADLAGAPHALTSGSGKHERYERAESMVADRLEHLKDAEHGSPPAILRREQHAVRACCPSSLHYGVGRDHRTRLCRLRFETRQNRLRLLDAAH